MHILLCFNLPMAGLGLSEDRLNYTIKCKSPGVVHVIWEITHSTRTEDLIVNTQYSCYNSTSNTVVSSYSWYKCVCACMYVRMYVLLSTDI